MRERLFDFSQFGDNVAIIDEEGRQTTYNQVQDISDTLGHYLSPGGLVLCLCSNSLASIAGYVAFIQHHCPTIMVDGKKNIDEYLKAYEPNYIWSPLSIDNGTPVFEIEGYGLYAYSNKQVPIHKDLALLLTTSGSTGSPKLVRLSEHNLVSNAFSIAEYLDITQIERAITSLPMHYSFGISVINSHFVKGATLLITERPVIDLAFWKFFKENNGTSIAGVPYTYEMLKRFRFFRMDLPTLKTMIQAGGRLAPEIVKEYADYAHQTGKRFFVMYGQTEAAPRISYLPFEKTQEKPSSIGIAIPGGELSLEDADGKAILSEETEGELVYKGENVCMGYAQSREELSQGDTNHGILHTGDLAKKDKDGYYFITGRKKRFVKIWGNRVSLDSIESIVKQATLNCACVGKDDKLVVFITDPDKKNSVEELLATTTGFNRSAFEIRVIPTIPKNETGKTQYSHLQSLI